MDDEERFWAKVDRSGGPDACWPWMGYRNEAGYGSFALAPGRRGHHKPTGAHRAAVIFTSGPITGRQVVRHTCDNPPCVNPRHLLVGSYSDNNRDMVERGRNHIQAGVGRKLDPDAVREIRASAQSPNQLARRYGVSRALVRKIRAGQVWKMVA